jgi:hypothetical protein
VIETPKYKLGYLEAGDKTNVPVVERERWLTLDRQILGLFQVMGNGIVDGWQLISNDPTSATVTITIGSGHINYIAAETVEDVTLSLDYDSVNMVYAGTDVDTYYSGYTRFVVTTTIPNDDTLLYLGSVTTNPEGSATAIDSIDMSGRKSLGFREALIEIVKDHRHIGGSDSPSKINLVTDVQGFLGPGNMADLDASLILRGVIDQERIPKLDHIEDLENNGILTHAQLDTFVQLLDNVGSRLMGEISTVNLLRLVLSLKHAIPGIDDYLVNEFAYIPGISPDDMVDAVNTTAIVDYRPSSEGGTHTITGTPAPATTTYTKSWDSRDEFSLASLSNTVLYGNSIMLGAVESKVYVEDFNNVGDWETKVFDSGDVSASFYFDPSRGDGSGRLDVGRDDSDNILQLSKTFDPQDWSGYDSLVFSVLCETAEHGDIYFYLSDATAGSQSSNRVVIDRNMLTYDESGSYGWMTVTVDISQYTRTKVNFVGFYVSTSAGWNTDIPFSLNVDEMFVTSGNFFKPNGSALFTYGNGTQNLYSYLRWNASIPVGTAIRARTRVANEMADLPYATWSSYMTTSGSAIDLPIPGNQYKYIQIEALFEASSDRRWSPQMMSLMLDCVFYGDDFGFSFSTEDSWRSGTLHNIDSSTVPGGITVANVSDIGNYVLGTNGSIRQLDDSFTQTLAVYGSLAPRSYRQMKSGGVGFGKLTSVDISPSGSFLVSDSENDRVIELSRDGRVSWGLSGMYSYDPTGDYPYALPQTEVSSSEVQTATTEAQEIKRSMKVVGCYYNEPMMRLSVFFDEDLSDVYSEGNIDLSKFVISAGARRLRLGYNNATPSLFGIDREHSGINDLPDGYFKSSNVLFFDIAQPDAVALATSSQSTMPYLIITNPVRNAIVPVASPVQVDLSVVNAVFGTEVGISISIDGSIPITFYDMPSYTFNSLSAGSHTVTAFLVDMSGNILAGDQVSTSLSFYVDAGGYVSPHLKLIYPYDNQQVSSGLIEVGLQYVNVPAGAKVRHSVDGGTPIDHLVTSPLYVSVFPAGRHTIKLFLTNSSNVPLAGQFSEDTIHIDMYLPNSTSASLSVAQDAIKSYGGYGNLQSRTYIEFTPVIPANIYCPIDARYSFDNSSVGDGSYDTVVAKIGVKSYPNYYVASASSFVDGSSVVEFRHNGLVSFSTSEAELARSRTDAMDFLGSVCKVSDDVVLIGDSSGRKAIVVKVDRNAATSETVWEYVSDRRVSDFSRFRASYTNISYDQDGLSLVDSSMPSGTSVTWTNNSSLNIRIMSGSTNLIQFQADPDLSLFGDEFDSGVLPPGSSFSHVFLEYGTYDYFVWPAIDTGCISISDYPVSSQDKFVIVENDPVSSSYSSRVAIIDSWGNVEWSFGDSIVRRIKDARPSGESGITITV